MSFYMGDLFPNLKIHGYCFIREIGNGQFSAVWEAIHEKTKTNVAIKCIPIVNEDTKEKVMKEVIINMKVNHPYICHFFEYFQNETYFFLVFEKCHENLLTYTNKIRFLNEQVAHRVFYQLVNAIDIIHNEHLIIHRDIKVDNVLLDENKNIRLIDFGLSVSRSSSRPRLNKKIINQTSNANASNVNASNVNSSNVNALNVNESNANASNVNSSNVNVSNINASNVNALNVNESNANASNINASNVNALNVNASNVNASNIESNQSFNHRQLIFPSSPLKQQVGSMYYMSPEMLQNEEYDQSIDIWSLGVVLFSITNGILPFDTQNDINELKERILYTNPQFVAKLSPSLKDLIMKMLEKDRKKRITIDQIKNHEWFSIFIYKLVIFPIMDKEIIIRNGFDEKFINNEIENEINNLKKFFSGPFLHDSNSFNDFQRKEEIVIYLIENRKKQTEIIKELFLPKNVTRKTSPTVSKRVSLPIMAQSMKPRVTKPIIPVKSSRNEGILTKTLKKGQRHISPRK